jgi:hypothetical protein
VGGACFGAGAAGDAFEGLDAGVGFAHGACGAEGDAGLAADAGFGVEEDCVVFVSGEGACGAEVDAEAALVADVHLVGVCGFDDLDGAVVSAFLGFEVDVAAGFFACFAAGAEYWVESEDFGGLWHLWFLL